MTNIIDGKQLAQNILEHVKNDTTSLIRAGVSPRLAVVFVGHNGPSRTYIKRKKEAAEYVQIMCDVHRFDEDISENTLIQKIQDIQSDDSVHGIIVQLPLSKHLDTHTILNTLDPDKDVDCMTDKNMGKLVTETNILCPPTPLAVLTILDNIHAEIKGKNITIVGAGALVGKPLAIMLVNKQATVTICNEFTTDLKKKTQKADILITAVGKKDLITKDMVKKGVIMIDTGIAFEHKKMYGDVDFLHVAPKSSYITPTPGGIGPITVSLLLANVVHCAKHI